jgi:hypothetical protein
VRDGIPSSPVGAKAQGLAAIGVALARALTLSDIADVPEPRPTVPPTVAPGEAAGLDAATGVELGAAGDPGAESQAAAAAASAIAIDSNR